MRNIKLFSPLLTAVSLKDFFQRKNNVNHVNLIFLSYIFKDLKNMFDRLFDNASNGGEAI